MKVSQYFSFALVVVALVLPAVQGVSKYEGEYLVRLSDTSQATHDALLRAVHPLLKAPTQEQVFNIGSDLKLALFKGVNASTLRLLRNQVGATVEYVEANGEMHALQSSEQPNPPSWGLPRVGQRDLPLQSVYRYPTSAGRGADVYVVDTGILLTHNDFGGRASWGYTAPEHSGEGDVDRNGHGTHCAGTVGGRQYGVAKQVNLIAVKVLGAGGSGSFAGVISGIEYATTARGRTGRPSVISLSLGGGFTQSVNDAIDASARAGVHNTISAGNDNGRDACLVSPASAPLAFTVAAADQTDTRASFTNLGECIDVWAPGVDITSAYIGGNDASITLSGTSMSAPHVAGVMALFLTDNGEQSPAQLASMIQSLATEGKIRQRSKSSNQETEEGVVKAVQPSTNETFRNCNSDSDCGRSRVCCPGSPRFCTTRRYEVCCAQGSCQGYGAFCCNPGQVAPPHCCAAGEECRPNNQCYDPLWDKTPNLNLYSNPPN